MKAKGFPKTVKFRDANMCGFCISINLDIAERKPHVYTNRETLEEFEEYAQISFQGRGPMSCGQCNSHINPRTKGQKELLELWDKYHLNGMSAGTDVQMEYLYGGKYQQDYELFLKLFGQYDAERRTQWMYSDFRTLEKNFNIKEQGFEEAEQVIVKHMDNNPLVYILGDNRFKREHGSTDLYVQYMFLAMNGLLHDRGYKYGSSWLHTPIPDDIEEIIDSLCKTIENEEKELTKELDPVFDMGNEDFRPNNKIVIEVMNRRNCRHNEALNFIALGMYMKCTFGDLNNTLQIDSNQCVYHANGHSYYVGSCDELEGIAKKIMLEDSCFKDFWKGSDTDLSFNKWVSLVLDEDGFSSILNHYDGTHKEFSVNGKLICVCPYC